jgi:enoyl-CoA hydratase
MSDEVIRERHGQVEVLTINRPEARNAINGAVSREMSAALDELATDDGCRVVVVTGAGDKAFSAGMDLKAFAAGEAGDIMGANGGFAGLTQRTFDKPIIAAVNGHALAGGCEIMLACDLVVAVEGATFGIPEVKRGLFAGAGALIRLP